MLVNEVAPRTHNSGHYTIEACLTDQFEQHLRAILGLPLGATDQLCPAAMVNLLGAPGHRGRPLIKGLEAALAIPDSGGGGVELHVATQWLHEDRGQIAACLGLPVEQVRLVLGGVDFSSKMGQLAGNHFLTLTTGLENLPALGKKVLWEGAQDIRFELID